MTLDKSVAGVRTEDTLHIYIYMDELPGRKAGFEAQERPQNVDGLCHYVNMKCKNYAIRANLMYISLTLLCRVDSNSRSGKSKL